VHACAFIRARAVMVTVEVFIFMHTGERLHMYVCA